MEEWVQSRQLRGLQGTDGLYPGTAHSHVRTCLRPVGQCSLLTPGDPKTQDAEAKAKPTATSDRLGRPPGNHRDAGARKVRRLVRSRSIRPAGGKAAERPRGHPRASSSHRTPPASSWTRTLSPRDCGKGDFCCLSQQVCGRLTRRPFKFQLPDQPLQAHLPPRTAGFREKKASAVFRTYSMPVRKWFLHSPSTPSGVGLERPELFPEHPLPPTQNAWASEANRHDAWRGLPGT